jgi:hypothetical protein
MRPLLLLSSILQFLSLNRRLPSSIPSIVLRRRSAQRRWNAVLYAVNEGTKVGGSIEAIIAAVQQPEAIIRNHSTIMAHGGEEVDAEEVSNRRDLDGGRIEEELLPSF